ncbi:MAG: Cdc6/Cdc18 family protein [Methanomethylophilus sp.]
MTADSLFKKYLEKKNRLIKDRKILDKEYIPDQLLHRDKEISEIVDIIAPSLSKDKPSNILIIGQTGTGKTAVVKYVGKELEEADKANNCRSIYVNCEVVDTPYSILYNIANQIITDPNRKIPFTGWSLEKIFNELANYIDEEDRIFLIVLDEIDMSFRKNGDDIFYYLTTINEMLKKSRVSIIGITNNSMFAEKMLTPKIRSRLGEEKIVFPPYSPDQLIDILRDRAKDAFYPDVLSDDVIPYCAAIAAQDSGDARKALDLLRVSADVAERNDDEKITKAHVDYARQKLELDAVYEVVRNLTEQSKIVLMSIIKTTPKSDNGSVTTGNVYATYVEISSAMGYNVLTQRMVANFISELDMLGIITARVKSFGRAGRTREIEKVPQPIVDILEKDEIFNGVDFSTLRAGGQTRFSIDG